MAVLGNQGVNAAQQRALLGSQMDTSELGMAQQLGNNLMNYNQTLGFTDPMLALQQIQSLATQPNFQSPETTYYTPSNLWKNLSSSTNAFTVGGGGGGGVAAPNVLGGNGSGAMITPQTLGQMYGLGSQLGTTLGGIMGGVTTASAYSPAMYELGQMIGSSVGSGVGADLGMMALA